MPAFIRGLYHCLFLAGLLQMGQGCMLSSLFAPIHLPVWYGNHHLPPWRKLSMWQVLGFYARNKLSQLRDARNLMSDTLSCHSCPQFFTTPTFRPQSSVGAQRLWGREARLSF